jgi:DNA-binding response OmpR family regulator
MKTVLIIDDEKDLCALLKKALNKEQYLVDCVYTLADAGYKLKDNHPDIILLDNNLPDGSGLDYYNKYTVRFKKSLVVFITADSASDIDERVDLSGVAAFIRKPFSLGVLKDTFKRLA